MLNLFLFFVFICFFVFVLYFSMKKISLFLLFTFVILSVDFVNSQSSWKKINSENYTFRTELAYRKSEIKKADLYSFSLEDFKQEITNKTILLPTPNGKLSKFEIKETSNFTKPLAQKYGYIKSFSIKGIDDKTADGKISIGNDGVFVTISSRKHGTTYIDPYTEDKKIYTAYKKENLKRTQYFNCLTKNTTQKKEVHNSSTSKRTANDGKLRVFRLALACTGEYSQFHVANQGLSQNTSPTQKRAAVLSAMNTTITRVNSIYERDLSVRMNIVLDNNGENKLIFLNPDTDNLSNNDAVKLIEESQKKCDDLIGSANYDIGHTFSTGSSGLAYIGAVCFNQQKAGGVTGINNPIGDPFDIDYVCHEIGHQFGAFHTFNNSCDAQKHSEYSVEPGSGSSIMGYAGICSPNVQNNSDSYFSSTSIDNMWHYIKSNASCATIIDTNNSPPTVNAGVDVSVPKLTPLVLKGSATDVENPNSLTYCWEQIDGQTATMPPLSSNVLGPLFRSLPPTSSPNRFLPKLATVIAGNISSKWEILPSVAREMNFSLLVRDNNPNGGANGRDNIKINVIDTKPFKVTSQNIATSWNVGSSQNITWDTSTTNKAPINCKNVTIKLSTDGGITFPIVLAEKTPNDGKHSIVVPNVPTQKARILIEATDNIFYNVNSINFNILRAGATFLVQSAKSTKSVCNTNNSVTFQLNLELVGGFNETISLNASGLPNNAIATFSPSVVNSSGNVTMKIDNLKGATAKEYQIKITGKSLSKTQTTTLALKVQESSLQNPQLISPINLSENIGILPQLNWKTVPNATTYEVTLATDKNFNSILLNTTVNTNSYKFTTALKGMTTYYWKVKPVNNCKKGNNSAVFSFTTETPSYCTSTFTNSENSEFITNVTFNTINNNSGDDHENPNADGYQDFTPISTTVILGNTYPIKVSFKVKGFQDHCYVFIDWNQDFIFDENEHYSLGILYKPPNKPSAPGPLTANITVPKNAVLGKTRMRVIIEYTDDTKPHGNGACDADHKSESGETEDYTIYVSKDGKSNGVITKDFLTYPNPSGGKVFVKFKTKIKNNITVKLFNSQGRLVTTKNYKASSDLFFEQISFSNISSGLYFMEVSDGINTKNSKIIFR